MTAPRLCCAVPFCRSTTGKPYSEWVCAKHWRLVPKKVKAFRRRADAAGKRAGERRDALTGMDDHRYADAMLALFKARSRQQRAWERCKRAAIERGMGI